MKKISIVIPSYNNERFLQKTLDSVLNQSYSEKEIIVVDDGSTDNSVDLIKKIVGGNKKVDIKLLCQNNLNAAIARNEGIKIATGDYILFLDSDDMLEEEALAKMIDTYDDSKVDLLIGSYEEIDEEDSCIGEMIFTDKEDILSVKKNFSRLLNINPVPSNKLYDLKLIRANNLEWGNVRIGQDLNFYFKYLLLCKKVRVVPWNIYKYRVDRKNSMSKTFDFRIFDIVNTFEDIKRFYNQNSQLSLYMQYIPALASVHYYMQMSKQMFYKDAKTRRLIVRYFVINEKNLDYSLCKNCDNDFKKNRLKFRAKSVFLWIFTSRLYCKYKIKKITKRKKAA